MNELISIISIVVICHTVGFVMFVALYHTYKYTTEISRNDIRCLELEYDLLKLEYNLLKLENEINDNKVAFTTLYNNKPLLITAKKARYKNRQILRKKVLKDKLQ